MGSGLLIYVSDDGLNFSSKLPDFKSFCVIRLPLPS